MVPNDGKFNHLHTGNENFDERVLQTTGARERSGPAGSVTVFNQNNPPPPMVETPGKNAGD